MAVVLAMSMRISVCATVNRLLPMEAVNRMDGKCSHFGIQSVATVFTTWAAVSAPPTVLTAGQTLACRAASQGTRVVSARYAAYRAVHDDHPCVMTSVAGYFSVPFIKRARWLALLPRMPEWLQRGTFVTMSLGPSLVLYPCL